MATLPLVSLLNESEKRARHFPDLGSASDWSRRVGFPDLGSDPSSVWNFYAVSQTSFGGETGSSVAKCQLFSQARSVNQIVLFNGFLSDFAEITSCIYTKTIILFNLGE